MLKILDLTMPIYGLMLITHSLIGLLEEDDVKQRLFDGIHDHTIGCPVFVIILIDEVRRLATS